MQYFDKINTCFKRDLDHSSKTYNCIIPDQLTTPEFELLRKYNVKWEATEKVDGECTSIHLIPQEVLKEEADFESRAINLVPTGEYEYKVEVHGKTDKANMRPDEVELLKKIGDKDKLLSAFTLEEKPNCECIIFGETYGKGMQKPGGRYCKDHLKFICFDIKVGHTWLKRESVIEICDILGIDVVPYLGDMTLDEAIAFVKMGFPSEVAEDPTLLAEGVVLRAPLGLLDRMGRRIITKVKYKDFVELEAKLNGKPKETYKKFD